MGISGGIFLIALGAVLTFAIEVEPRWIDLKAAGVIVILAGGAVMLLTLWYWQDRRRRAAARYRRAAHLTLPPPDAGRPTARSPSDPPSSSGPTDGT